MKPIGVYIHIPFCMRKCPYCDFYSVGFTETEADTYTEKLCHAIQKLGRKRQADTLYFGGGTPSVLGAERLCRIAGSVKEAFSLADNAEVTVEVNPAKEDIHFAMLKQSGFNRVSIGLQSADDRELALLGGLHDVRQAKQCIAAAKRAGFGNISLDLMIATPQQTKESLKRSIAFCAEQGVQHISAYLLKMEEGTPYFAMRDQLALCSDDEQAEMYLLAVETLKSYGFVQYEISNFCQKGFESRHNLKYWHDEEYIGIGSSAHSFLDGKRFYYRRSMEEFYRLQTVPDGEGGSMEEYIMLALRLSEGLRHDCFQERFHTGIPERYLQNALRFAKTNLLCMDGDGLRLTPQGFLVSNALIAEILS